MLAFAGALARNAAVIAWAAVTAVVLSGIMVRIIFGRPLWPSAWIAAKPERVGITGS